MHAVMVPNSNITAYMIRDEDEFLHEGHAWQHSPQAALPQQHASCNDEKIEKYQDNADIFNFKMLNSFMKVSLDLDGVV